MRGVEAGAGGRDGGGERAPVAASGGGGGGEFEAAAGPDVRSAAELTALDTFRHAEEEYPKWEEELFGSPAGARPAHPAARARPPTGCLAALKIYGFFSCVLDKGLDKEGAWPCRLPCTAPLEPMHCIGT